MHRYIPQVVLNYQRKSTEGWNISNSLTDIAGGIFSIMQQCVDAYALQVRTLPGPPSPSWLQTRAAFVSCSCQSKYRHWPCALIAL